MFFITFWLESCLSLHYGGEGETTINWIGVPLEFGGEMEGGPKNYSTSKAIRMEFSIVQNLSGLRGSIFCLFRSPQFNSCKKTIDRLFNYTRSTKLTICFRLVVGWFDQNDF